MSFPEFAGVILRHGSHFFFIQRSLSSRHWPHYWGFPGGKREPDESIFSAAKRELQEEIGIDISSEDIIGQIEVMAHYVDGDRKNTLFLIENWRGTPENLEPKIHSDINWFTLDELPSPVIPHVREGLLALLAGETTLTYNGGI